VKLMMAAFIATFEHYLWLIPLGVMVGGFGTIIGAGGGFILVPILLLLYPNKSPETITTISLAVVFINSLIGSLSYARMKAIDYKSGILLASTTVPASIIGSLTIAYVPRRLFDIAFALLMLTMSTYIFLRAKSDTEQKSTKKIHGLVRNLVDAEGNTYTYSFNPVLGLTTGALIGYISSLLGIGGGIIHVPVLIHLLNFPVHLATATSHFMLAIMSLTGSLVHFRHNFLIDDIIQIVAIGIGVIIGAPLGANLSRRIKGVIIQRSLALALGLVGIRLLILAFYKCYYQQ
jgi:uncharacterized membrane protein YfcA